MAAARNDQVLQGALIVFVILSVFLGAFLVYVNRLKADYRQQAEKLTEEKQAEVRAKNKFQAENEFYRTTIGFGQFAELDEVQPLVEQDRQTYMRNLGEADRNYRTAVTRLDAEIKRTAEQEDQAKQREKQLKARLLQTEKEKDAQIKEMEETLRSVQAAAASERNTFNEDRASLKRKEQQALDAVRRQRAEYEKQIAGLKSNITTLSGELAKVEKARDTFISQLDEVRRVPSFEIADGRVSYVNQATGTVWINLGEADSLRRQVTFSVYAQSAADAGKAEKKASIEVIQLLDDHLAEARITSDDPRDPILKNDWIYSPLWNRGKKVRFALTGLLDLDDDGKADLQRVQDLVALNGAEIDAIVTKEGGVEGEISEATRYLVLGEFPSKPSEAGLRDSYNRMKTEAAKVGVTTITLTEFLNQMGYRPVDRTVKLGSGTRERDFVPPPPRFRPRTPYVPR